MLVGEKKANVTFHVCMAFAAIYMCILYTGWGYEQVTESLLTVLLYGCSRRRRAPSRVRLHGARTS